MPETTSPHHVNRTQLAVLFGCDPKTIDRYRSDGLPVVSPGAHGKATIFDLVDAIAWLRKHERAAVDIDSYSDARRRREIANATLAEIEAAERQRTMVSTADVGAAVEEIFQVVRSRLDAVPVRCAAPASGQPMETVEKVVRDEIEAALGELQEFKLDAI